MFDWLPELSHKIHTNLIQLYWILIAPFVLLLIILEFFRFPEKSIGATNIIKRAVVSVILLLTFQDITNFVSSISDGIVDFVEGPTKIMDLLEVLKQKGDEYKADLFDFKQHIVLFFSFLAYLIAYLGVFVSNALIHFVTGILYCVSPLMILMYCSERTSFICTNLYKGLLSVATWRILWSILGAFLLKLATHPAIGDWGNVFTSIIVSVCVGISMLFIPYFAKSLISDGLVSMASGMAVAPAAIATGVAKAYLSKQAKAGVSFAGQKVARPLWRASGGFALKESKNALRFASELGHVPKAKSYAKGKFNNVKGHILEGRKKTADFIKNSMGVQTKHADLSKKKLPKNVIRINFKKGDE